VLSVTMNIAGVAALATTELGDTVQVPIGTEAAHASETVPLNPWFP